MNMENKEQNLKKGRTNQIKIMSQRCAGYLMYHGCHIIRTELNTNNPYYQVFVFYNDEKVQRWLERYSNEQLSIGNADNKTALKGNKNDRYTQSKSKDYQD